MRNVVALFCELGGYLRYVMHRLYVEISGTTHYKGLKGPEVDDAVRSKVWRQVLRRLGCISDAFFGTKKGATKIYRFTYTYLTYLTYSIK